jgi:hypothetical protein
LLEKEKERFRVLGFGKFVFLKKDKREVGFRV